MGFLWKCAFCFLVGRKDAELQSTCTDIGGSGRNKQSQESLQQCTPMYPEIESSSLVYCIFMYLLKQPAFKSRLYIWFHWWVRFFAYGIFWKSAFNLVNRTCQTNRLSRLKSLAIFSGILNWNPKMITQGWYLKQRSVNQDHQTTSMQAMCRYCSVILSMVYLKCLLWYLEIFRSYFNQIHQKLRMWFIVDWYMLMYLSTDSVFPVWKLDPLDEGRSIYYFYKGCIPDWYKYDCSLEHYRLTLICRTTNMRTCLGI